jgi:hypothetical protein
MLQNKTSTTKYDLYNANTMQKQQQINKPDFIKKTNSRYSA